MFQHYRLWRIWLCMALFMALPIVAAAQTNYPGAALFSYRCEGAGIVFYQQGTPVIQVSLDEIAAPLSTAISARQNQPIKYGAGVSLWALQSDELQIHRDENPDATKLVLSSSICGTIPTPSTNTLYSGLALAYVQLDGPGRALALAQVTASGQVAAYTQIAGSGYALAYSQSNAQTGNGGAYHIVQPGENLFRIALRYGTTVSVLSAINHIGNTRLIYVGQIIYLP
jgi:LysM repeat protein